MKFGTRIKRWWRRITAPTLPRMGRPTGRWCGGLAAVELGPALELHHRLALEVAVEWWNEHRGIFVMQKGSIMTDSGWPTRHGVITVTTSTPVGGPEVKAATELFFLSKRGGTIASAHMEIRHSVKGDDAARAFAHELGHVLGLGHTLNATKDHLMGLHSPGWVLLPEELEYVQNLAGFSS